MKRLLALTAGLLLVLAACGNDVAEVVPEDVIDDDGAPTLRILSPEAGATVTQSFEVSYEVTNFDVGDPPLGHIHVIFGDAERDFVAVYPEGQSGTLTVDGLDEGTYDLTFALANANHSLVDAPEAQVTVSGVVVAGNGADDAPGGPAY